MHIEPTPTTRREIIGALLREAMPVTKPNAETDRERKLAHRIDLKRALR